MQITVKLTPDVARQLGPRVSAADATGLVVGMKPEEAGFEVKPLHPGSDDPELGSYYTVDVEDDEQAGRVLDQLRSSSLVDGAYVKPADELP